LLFVCIDNAFLLKKGTPMQQLGLLSLGKYNKLL